jgi:hypothetical protein
MNPELQKKIETILSRVQPTDRDEIARNIAGCNFTDPADPLLNILLTLVIVSGQPLRLAETGGAALATEAGVARGFDRLENKVWSLFRLKLFNVFLGCLMSAIIALGTGAISLKMRPEIFANTFNLPRAADARIVALNKAGMNLHVASQNDLIVIWVDGVAHATAEQTNDGLNYLQVKP